MSLSFVDLEPSEAVSRAREIAVESPIEALEALDRHLRRHLLTLVQDCSTPSEPLRAALLAACRWAEGEKLEPWRQLWPYLLELLRDAEETPALAADLRALKAIEGRAAEVLTLLSNSEQPLQPSEVARRLAMSEQHVSNLVRKLEAADLVVRRRAGGRATWLFSTARGGKLGALLQALPTPEQVKRAEAALPQRVQQLRQGATPPGFWNPEAVRLPVEIH
jgi:DNA-binding MarR family transcriptional regulator